MLVAFQAFNNITAYRLLIASRVVPLDLYCHQTTNDFEKLLKQKNAKNILKIATLILVTIDMHIGPTKYLEIGPYNAKYDSKKRLYKGCTSAD